jgi:hypothetical protein
MLILNCNLIVNLCPYATFALEQITGLAGMGESVIVVSVFFILSLVQQIGIPSLFYAHVI